MSEDLQASIQELFGHQPECDFLSLEEIEALGTGRLDPARREAFDGHAENCSACDTLLDDLASFEKIEEKGPLPAEKREFARTDRRVRTWIGLARGARPALRFLYWALAPAAALVIVALLFQAPPRHPTLIESVPEVPMKPPPIVRGPALAVAWSEATEAWERDDMAAVIRILEPAAEVSPDEAELHFYLGLARLRLDDGPGAVKDLERADGLHEPPSAIIRWTLVAALERASRFKDACRVLRSVADLEGARADEARRIASENCSPPG